MPEGNSNRSNSRSGQRGISRAQWAGTIHRFTNFMEFLKNLFSNPFFLGLIVGLLPTALAWKSTFACKLLWKKEKQQLGTEIRDLQAHLNTQLKINALGNDTIQKDLEKLRSENETLRINLAAVQQKPEKAAMRQWHINEAAVRTMREQAPGFAAAWERAVREAEAEADSGDKGLTKFLRKVIPGLGQSKPKQITDSQNPNDSDS